MVARDKNGNAFSVRYDQVNAMLLNEFLKEYRKVHELESRLSQQQKQIERLSDGLLKVSAQLETAAPWVCAESHFASEFFLQLGQ